MLHKFKSASAYRQVNITVILLIGLLFCLLISFTAAGRQIPIDCVHIATHGEQCSTCGLSRSFSEMIRGDYDSALMYNRNGPLLFAFFLVQLLLRVGADFSLTCFYRAGKKKASSRLAIFDGIFSLALFLVCFRHLLELV